MLNNIYHGIKTAIVFLSATLCGCSEDWGLEYYLDEKPSDYVVFSSDLEPIGAKVTTRTHSGNIMMESEDWVIKGKEANTRVAPTLSLSGEAGVLGYIDDNATPITELGDVSFTFNNESLNATGSPVSWKKVESAVTTLHVYAYAPYNVVHAPSSPAATITPNNTIPYLNFTVPDDVANQVDLITAKGDVAKASFRTTVPLTFNHILTAIRFKIDFACRVKSLSINGVYKSGKYTFGTGWSNQATKHNYTFGEENFTEEGTDVAANDYVLSENNTLMLLPQTIDEGATVVLEYSEGGVNHVLTAEIDGHQWLAGKRVTYTISKAGVSYIYFDLAAGNVTISGGTYSGKIYYNNGANVQTVSGSHSSANKYYVYQSSTNSTSPGYTNNTGYEGAYGSGAVRIPAYAELRYNGKLWREYITGKKESEDIIDLWADANSDGVPDSHPIVTDQYRTGTSNKISLSTTSIDMTIDNIWSTSTDYNQGSLTLSSGGMTLRLKGDNFLHKIRFSCSDNFIITSFNGDGSEEGSLTITPHQRLYPVGTGSDPSPMTGTSTNYRLKFKGGTVYAASALSMVTQVTQWVMGGICAPSHTDLSLEITGGALTSVAHGTGAAIGGGAGMLATAGAGYVRITGGRTYAYQYGITSDVANHPEYIHDYRFPVPTTAIGGGSSFCGNPTGNAETATLVEIAGDAFVYAESVGGVAIGGGSSGGLRGGVAEIYIGGTKAGGADGGTPTVYAKSVPGTIHDPYEPRDHSVPAGTSIGGGNGGDEDKKIISSAWQSYDTDRADGAKATVRIYGGNIYAGSIGGGKAGTAPTSEGKVSRKVGSADIVVSGGIIQGQFVMQAGAATAPTFTMSGGLVDNVGLTTDKGFYKIKNDGGAVYIGGGINPGSFTMNGGTIQNSNAVNGGVVYQEGGSFIMNNGTIDRGSATSGGAFYISGGDNTQINGGIIQNSTSTSNGGAVMVSGGNVLFTSGTLSKNRSDASGGGIYINNGSLTMSSGLITGNYAAMNGGGVSVSTSTEDVTVNITGGTIIGNSAGNFGGGISVIPGANRTSTVILGLPSQDLTNPDISANGANKKGGGVYTSAEASNSSANIIIDSGRVIDNIISSLEKNPDVANDGGMVTLNKGDVTHVEVTYHKNDGIEPEVTTSQNIVTNVNSTLVTPSWSIGGKTLTGWYRDADCTLGNPDDSNNPYLNGTTVHLSSGLHLYAKWE